MASLAHLRSGRTAALDLLEKADSPFPNPVSSRIMIVIDGLGQDLPQMPMIEHDDMVQAFPPNRSNNPLHYPFCQGDFREVTIC